jgi:hypothetical protein
MAFASAGRTARRCGRTAALVALVVLSACAKKTGPDLEPDPTREPIPLHVKNENFLDMNVFVVVGGMSRRLGTVTGNGSVDLEIPYSLTYGQPFSLRAQPIGGSGAGISGILNVGYGQMVEFKIASILRQSAASVHEPR